MIDDHMADTGHEDMILEPALREREYSPSSCIGGDYRPFIEAYAQRSLAAREQALQAGALWLQVPYGARPSQRMELCLPPPSIHEPASPAAAGRGLLVFIHGGYWQELSARDSLFAAGHCVDRGLAFCALDYTLAPQASVSEIVDECRLALKLLADRAATWGIDKQRIVVAGSSAGAHLAAMVCLSHWRGEHGAHDEAKRAFKPLGAVLLSGIYQLQPLVDTSINDALGLDGPGARAVSPALLRLEEFPQTVVAWGDNETAAFKRQSRRFAESLRRAACPSTEIEIAGRNHFDVVLDLADPQTPLGRRTLALFEPC